MDGMDGLLKKVEALIPRLGDPEDAVARAAARALWQMLPLAPAGMPRVLEELRSGSPAGRRNAAHVLRLVDWNGDPPEEARAVVPALTAALDDPDPSVRRAAAEALCENPWLRRAEAARPALARLAGEPDASIRTGALRALQHPGDRGPDAIHALAAGLQDADPAARVAAAVAFASRSRHPDPAIKAVLTEALAVSDPAVRASALQGLWSVDWSDPASLAIFVEHLKDPDPRVRGMAALQIMNVGWNDREIAKPAVPALVEALGQGVRHAPRALVKIAPDEPSLRAFLVDSLQREGEKLHAASLLLEIGAEVEAALAVLLEELRRGRPGKTFLGRTYCHTSRNDAAQALLEHAPASEGLAAELRSFLADPDPVIRTQIALAIARLDPSDDAALAAITTALKDTHGEVRQRALAGLRHVVQRNERVVPLLLEALGDPSEGVRSCACWVLGELGSPPAAAVPLLAACLGARDLDLRCQAIRLLGRVGPEAREAEPALVELLGSPEEGPKAQALVALARIGPSDASAVPSFVEALGSEDSSLRAWALLGLQKLGPLAARAVPAVSSLLRDPDPGLRLRSALALAAMGAGAGAASVLEDLARQADETIRAPAAEGLAALRRGG